MNRVAVVVPAHDEQDLLPACLGALATAAEQVAPVPVEIIVVADACTDDTAALATAAGAHVVTGTDHSVGHARAAGMAYALRHGPDGLWLATTDADSRVDPAWLRWQLRAARAGADLLIGTVEVDDWSPWPEALRVDYESRYRGLLTGITHTHEHGANLGCTARAYQAAGGFPAVTHDEDRALIAAFRAAGARIVTDSRCPVLTSARPAARAPAGFAAHLADLL
ncbi:glycosyltransferase [Micromonosporaceae bacterium Da 78-11]